MKMSEYNFVKGLGDLKKPDYQYPLIGLGGLQMLLAPSGGTAPASDSTWCIKPKTWRKWLKPRFERIITRARKINPRVFVWYHSDGFIEPIIPDLIEIGVDVLNPVQPESMDPVKLKKEFGDNLAFWGTIGIQTNLPFGTPEEVRKVVKERIETVGKGGGLVIGPAHAIEPEVPLENIAAFVEAAKEYGKY